MRPSPGPHARKPLRLLALGGTTLVDSGGAVATIAAWRSVVEHRPGSRALLNRLDSLLLIGTPWHWALPEYRITARLWEAVGEPTLAVAAIRRRRMDIANYLAADLGEEGRLALAAGDTTGAIAAWRHYLALRSDPEPVLRTQSCAGAARARPVERGPNVSPTTVTPGWRGGRDADTRVDYPPEDSMLRSTLGASHALAATYPCPSNI
jgi:hypothetical protein